MNIKVISQYQFVCTRLSSAHTPTRKLVGVWALDKLVHTNRYCEITYNIIPFKKEAVVAERIRGCGTLSTKLQTSSSLLITACVEGWRVEIFSDGSDQRY